MTDALRNGNLEINHDGKDGPGKGCFIFFKEEVETIQSHQS